MACKATNMLCVRFESNVWKKEKCKNCGHTWADHCGIGPHLHHTDELLSSLSSPLTSVNTPSSSHFHADVQSEQPRAKEEGDNGETTNTTQYSGHTVPKMRRPKTKPLNPFQHGHHKVSRRLTRGIYHKIKRKRSSVL